MKDKKVAIFRAKLFKASSFKTMKGEKYLTINNGNIRLTNEWAEHKGTGT